MEDCPDGELTKEQFVEMYNRIFPGGRADRFSEIIFRTFDADRSGTIDFRQVYCKRLRLFTLQSCEFNICSLREFMLALHVTSSGTAEEKLSWAFKM